MGDANKKFQQKIKQEKEDSNSMIAESSNRCSAPQEHAEEEKIEIAAQGAESIPPESKNEAKEEKTVKPEAEERCDGNNGEGMKKGMARDANEMSLEELEDCSCLEESSGIDDSKIERVEESDFSEMGSEESSDSNISEASIEREGDEEDACSNSSDTSLGSKQIRYQNDLLLFRLEQSEKNEDQLKREIEELSRAIKNEAVLKKIALKEEEWMRKENGHEEKLERAEKALPAKAIQLIDCLRRDC